MRLNLRRNAVITREGLGAVADALSTTEGRNLDELAAATGLTLAQVVTHLALLIASDLAEGAIRAPRRIDEATVVTYVRKA